MFDFSLFPKFQYGTPKLHFSESEPKTALQNHNLGNFIPI